MSGAPESDGDVVVTAAEAERLQREPLIILEPLTRFLDDAGLGAGEISAVTIGAGHSNVTYALHRGPETFVLRRPPRGPLPASTHDVVREARLLRALAPSAVRVPDVLAICDTAEVIGAPFYVMPFIDGHVLGELPAAFPAMESGPAIAGQLVDALAELHAVDVTTAQIASFGRPDGYLERQLRRFQGLLEHNATRSLPELDHVADWLAAHLPAVSESTIVHGDYRLGNVVFARSGAPHIVALLDWEMATLGDPLADLGYLAASWAEPDDPADPILDLSPATRLAGFPTRTRLIERYAERTGRSLGNLPWYQTLALWKAAIFLEGSYRRFRAGSTSDPFFASLEEGVPRLARRAAAQTQA